MQSSDVLVRKARDADFEDLLSVLSQLRPSDAPLDPTSATLRNSWQHIKEQSGRALLVAELDGRVVGTIDCFITANLTHAGQPYATIENLVVDASCRRRGVGKALVDAVVSVARNAGCYKVQLLSNQMRRDAHSFYEAVGFAPSAQGYRIYFDSQL